MDKPEFNYGLKDLSDLDPNTLSFLTNISEEIISNLSTIITKSNIQDFSTPAESSELNTLFEELNKIRDYYLKYKKYENSTFHLIRKNKLQQIKQRLVEVKEIYDNCYCKLLNNAVRRHKDNLQYLFLIIIKTRSRHHINYVYSKIKDMIDSSKELIEKERKESSVESDIYDGILNEIIEKDSSIYLSTLDKRMDILIDFFEQLSELIDKDNLEKVDISEIEKEEKEDTLDEKHTVKK